MSTRFRRRWCTRRPCGSRSSSVSRRSSASRSGSACTHPWILPDEILYSDLARSIAAGDTPAVRGVSARRLGRRLSHADRAGVGASSATPSGSTTPRSRSTPSSCRVAAIPAYLLARLFVPRRDAVVVALLTVLVPSMAYTGVVMTENAFYPAFLWTMFLIARAIRRPTVASQLLALAGVAVLSATRIQGVGPRRGARGGDRALRPRRAARGAPRVPGADRPDARRGRSGARRRRRGARRAGAERVAGEQVGDVRRPAARRGAGVVRVPPGRPRPLRRADPRGCIRGRDRPRHPSACARARAALRLDRASDHGGPAADGLRRQRLDRRRRARDPQRAIRLLPRSAAVPRPRDLDPRGAPASPAACGGRRRQLCGTRAPRAHRPVRVQRGLPVAVAPSLARAVRLEGRARTRGRGVRGDRSRALAAGPGQSTRRASGSWWASG